MVPTSVKVVAILGIILGAFTVLAVPCSAVVIFGNILPGDPGMQALHNDSLYMTVSAISLPIGLVLGVLLLASSIGSLKLKAWARKGMLTFAVLSLIQSLAGTAFNLLHVLPNMPADPGPAGSAGRVGGMIGAVFGVVFACGISGVIWYFFNRPHVIDAFKGIFPASPPPFPAQYPPPYPGDDPTFPR